MVLCYNITPPFGWRHLQPNIPNMSGRTLVLHPHTGAGFSNSIKQQLSPEVNRPRRTEKSSSLHKDIPAAPKAMKEATERQHHSTRDKTSL